MMSDMSPKSQSDEMMIGYKGLGFRSLMNWAEKIEIASNGVRCTFSREIAAQRWEKIKKGFSEELAKKHEWFSSKSGLPCPVAMLSIPEVTDEQMDEHTTEIRLEYKETVLGDIEAQLHSLTGKVLLFLTHIHKIAINSDTWRVIVIERKLVEGSDPHVRKITVVDSDHPKGKKWTVYHTNGIDETTRRRYEVSIAYDTEDKESGKYIYTFFPTRVSFSLPLVLHATFELNSSRNSINSSEANNKMQERIADALCHFSKYLAETKTKQKAGQCDWDCFDIVNLTDQHDIDKFPLISAKLKKNIDDLAIYPTTGGSYQQLGSTTHYSEPIAEVAKQWGWGDLSNHLLKGYIERGIKDRKADISLYGAVTKKSQSILDDGDTDFAQRAILVKAVLSVDWSDLQDKLDILVDDRNQLTGKTKAYINVGVSIPELPSQMGITYVSETLVKKLIAELGIQDNKNRGLTKELSKCADVHDLDITAVKRSIGDYTKNAIMDVEGFKQLMFALYRNWRQHEGAIVEDLMQNFDVRLFAQDKERRYPTQMLWEEDDYVYDRKWYLFGTPKEWCAWFNAFQPNELETTVAEVRDFFTCAVGVSKKVPMRYVNFDGNMDEYLNTNSTALLNDPSIKASRFYNENKALIVEDDFLNGKSCQDIIKLICYDKRAMEAMCDCQLHYFYNRPREDTAKMSYSIYHLRQNKIFKPLSSYVVSERMCLPPHKDTEQLLAQISDKPNVSRFLILLGAKENIETFSLNELYKILMNLVDINMTSGIQKIYGLIRHAINERRASDQDCFIKLADDFKSNGKVYARRGKGELEVLPVSEVYYWDNDQLPRHILDEKPKLEIGSRVGEDSVKQIFGVKLAKDIKIEVEKEKGEYNKTLTAEIQKALADCQKYLLAYRIHGGRDIKDLKDIRVIANQLKKIDIEIFESCNYSVDGTESEMKENDMVTSDNAGEKVFYIRSTHSDYLSAIKNPEFCERIIETLCITLKVSGEAAVQSFRQVLKSDDNENKYIAKKEISDDEWSRVIEALGCSERELRFWVSIGNSTGHDLKQEVTNGSMKIDVLKKYFPQSQCPQKEFDDWTDDEIYRFLLSLKSTKINVSKALESDWLPMFYKEWIGRFADRYKNAYAHHLYEKTPHPSPTDYLKQCNKFSSKDWIEPLAEESKDILLTEDQLREKAGKAISETFKVEFAKLDENDTWYPEILSEYSKELERLHLDQSNIDADVLVYTYFEGYLDKFKSLININEEENKTEDNHADSTESEETPQISYGHLINKSSEPSASSRKFTSGKGYQSERAKLNAGLNAEQLVLNALKGDSKYEYVKPVSRNLGSIIGDDSKHYDILYRRKGENTDRYLEVKSKSGDSILMSALEYQFAMENKYNYDFAIVEGNKITIIKAPFAAPNPPLPKPDTYKITMEITSDNNIV